MAETSTCPSAEELRQLLLGCLPRPQAIALVQHLEGCDRCLNEAEALDLSGPPLLSVEEQALPPPPGTEVTVLNRIGRLKSLLLSPSPADKDTPQSSSVLDPAGLAELLAPGQEPEEIGRLGPYRVLKVLGKGGMAVVLLASQQQPRRQVAIKVILEGISGSGLQRFRSEADVVARLRHPHIVQIYQVGEHHGRPYFVMEYLEGGSLAQKLASSPLAPRAAVKLLAALAEAMQYAHSQGVLHRDLKPSNILLTADEQPRITDFGLAKQTAVEAELPAEQRTESGAILGTPSYMPAEQAMGQAVGPAADVYALGAILYECLTGRPPFRAATMLDTLQQVRSQEPVAPSRLQPGLPRDLETVCLKCLEKDPRKRYASAQELAEDLKRWQAGQPIRARRVGRLERAWKWTRRNPGVAGLLAAVLLVLAAGTVASTLFALEARRQADDARLSAEAAGREKTKGEEALAAESKARKRTREALDDMSSQVIEDWLARQGKLEPAQRAFLQKALAHYEAFAVESDNFEEVRKSVADAHLRVGNIRERLGQHAEAEAAYRRAQQVSTSLAADFPAVAGYRLDVARSHANLAKLLQTTGRLKEAEAAYHDALEICKPLATDFPEVPQYRQDLASSGTNLALLLANTSRPKEAEAAYRNALEIRKQLVRDFPAVPQYRQDLGRSHLNLGILLKATGRPKEAEAAFRDAQALYKPLATDLPTVPEYRQELALSYNNLGALLMETGRTQLAESAFRDALDIYKRLAADFPSVPQYRQDLARTHNNLAIRLFKTNPPQAEAAYREALDVRRRLAADFPTVPEYHGELANTLDGLAKLLHDRKDYSSARQLLDEARPHLQAALEANPRHPYFRGVFCDNRQVLAATLLELGDHAGAALAAADLARIAFNPSGDAYKAACFFSRCIPLAQKDAKLYEAQRQELAKSYGGKALAALQQALAKGYKDSDQLQKDKDLDPLRPRDDFQRLLKELHKDKPRAK
jgi:tetratricopeptide (TPR) repeat protein/predicted Ser/Thr protein kinase